MEKDIQIYHDVGGTNFMMLDTSGKSAKFVNVRCAGSHKATPVELNLQQAEDVIERLQRWVKVQRKKKTLSR